MAQYVNLPCPIDPDLAARVRDLMVAKGIKTKLNPNIMLVHDIYMVQCVRFELC